MPATTITVPAYALLPGDRVASVDDERASGQTVVSVATRPVGDTVDVTVRHAAVGTYVSRWHVDSQVTVHRDAFDAFAMADLVDRLGIDPATAARVVADTYNDER